jgi:hypothetical protein
MKKRIRERVGKAKGAGLSRMIRVHTSVDIFEVSKRDKTPYFVDVVKDKRRTKNNKRNCRVINACLCPLCNQKHQGGHGR